MGREAVHRPAAGRIKTERVPRGDDRSDFQRDRDIILYTSAFKRLSGITQVVPAHTGHVFHNRLTHSLQVAQVGRSLAEKLAKHQPDLATLAAIEPHAVEAGCLAHDLGHPPFGHVAEETLNTMVGKQAEGFEGNAQSFRIVAELAFRSPDFNGLNLTGITLQTILKYPWTFAKRPKEDGKKVRKWGAYGSELVAFAHATGSSTGQPVNRAIGAELMDWADDLTYAIHDVEDFYRAGLIPLHQLGLPAAGKNTDAERTRFLNYVWSRKAKIRELKGLSQSDLDSILGDILFSHFTIHDAYEGTRDQRQRLRYFTSQMVGRYINGLKLVGEASGRVGAMIDEGFKREISLLKQLTWCYVIEAPSLAVQQRAQKDVIRYLFEVFTEEARKNPCHLLPAYYQERLREIPNRKPDQDRGIRRMVADLIAGMTEAQAVGMYQRLKGIVMGSAFEEILV
jgi:dGTPase